ncbi:MAG TPA: hypothetical protein VIF14_04825 [Alphaproteobacteria bacterium]|jgi:hypothetical protein
MASRTFLPQAALALFAFAGLDAPARAHDEYDWIRKGGYMGVDGTRCCGKDDCDQIPAARVERTGEGYALRDYGLFVPFRQTQTSEDGKFWICRDAKAMRCFFAPPPGS